MRRVTLHGSHHADLTDAHLDDLLRVVAQRTDPADCPLATHLQHDVPVYDCAALRERLSPLLTLQGAVAHVDMPLESGPTLYLPHSRRA